MKNLKMFCLCINDKLLNRVKKLNYTPVALGQKKFSSDWLTDSTDENISSKNKHYGEYTFHYWFWKNMLNKMQDNQWIGFCAYRRFWLNEEKKIKNNIYDMALNSIPDEWNNYDVIIGDHIHLDKIKWIKVIKYGKLALLRNPLSFLKSKRNIRFHFDMFHGNGILDQAITLLNKNDRFDFKKYVTTKTSYNQGNMFICKSKKIINSYYETLFEWLSNCEKVFGFDLHGYGKIRVYAFLAERFLPYWFNKYTKSMEWPIIFHDLNSENN